MPNRTKAPRHSPSQDPRTDTHRTGIFLAALAVTMLGLAYASVPLYRLFCQKTGYGGTTQVALTKAPGAVGTKKITVRFNADQGKDLPWEFYPLQKEVQVIPGEQGFALYRSKNKASKPVSGMATYNVTPDKTGLYFSKIECFCFVRQTLQPGQEVDMPVLFYISPDILTDPATKDITTITLSYSFFLLD